MSDASTKTLSVNEIASTWLERVHSGTWSEEDQSSLDRWLTQSSVHRVAYWRLEDAWSQASRLSALRTPNTRNAAQPRRIVPVFVRTAVVVFVCGAIGVIATNYTAKPKTQAYATGLGGRESLALSDGSRIELNTDTALRIATNGHQRTVWMDKGEAYFQIKHDAAHPFVVFASGHRITDIGTKFLVRQDKGRIEVSLVEGRARVDASSFTNGSSAVLTPGEVAIATATNLSVTRKSPQKLVNQLDWRHDQITFSETTLADAATEFNRYNTAKLIVSDPAIAKIKINGTFPTDGAEMFARVAQHIWQLRIKKRGEDIVISH